MRGAKQTRKLGSGWKENAGEKDEQANGGAIGIYVSTSGAGACKIQARWVGASACDGWLAMLLGQQDGTGPDTDSGSRVRRTGSQGSRLAYTS